MKVILDNGHGVNTPGKRSPVWSDGKQLLEYQFNREIVKLISSNLGENCIILVPEEIDISLSERCNRANNIYSKLNKNCFLLSIHANAGGGTGWECFTSKGKTKSDEMADIFYNEAKIAFPEFKMRSDTTDGDFDKEDSFTILTKTQCPAILTENFFMDTESDCRFIMSVEGKERIAEMHIKAINKILNIYG